VLLSRPRRRTTISPRATRRFPQASDLKDETAFDAANAALEKGDADYRACMGEHLSADPAFPALLARAQALADHMAGK